VKARNKNNSPRQKPVARKTSRLLKASQTFGLGSVITIKGKTPSQTEKSFHFKVLTAAQQMKERNKAYKFFSID